MKIKMNKIEQYAARSRLLNDKPLKPGKLVYWMSRDQRVADNWALLYTQALAQQYQCSWEVVFVLVPQFLGATMRQYDFMLRGLNAVQRQLNEWGIAFKIFLGNPAQVLNEYTQKNKVGAIICDFDPLRIKRDWKNQLAKRLDCALYEVDTHNIVPVWVASSKAEYAARTIRPKIQKQLPHFLTDFPEIDYFPSPKVENRDFNKDKLIQALEVEPTIPPVDWLTPGESGARQVLQEFLEDKLARYAEESNDPNKEATSNLSPYLHFGQIAAQRVALEVKKQVVSAPAKEAFLEELIIRKELSDNFCFYNDDYDQTSVFPGWAQKTLATHASDPREYLYTAAGLEQAQTHDELWNAAQMEMVKTGKMHGYLRMYWAKKILEWSPDTEQALKSAIILNDRYELDGRDPNGYAGIAWALGGVHDRAWRERDIFGKIRYMNQAGCRRKFAVDEYIAKINHLF